MIIKFAGAHNTESRNTRMSGVIIDGVLALDAGGLTSTLTLEEQDSLKAVLLTHQHYDHVRDIPALGMNLYLGGGSIDIYCGKEPQRVLTAYLLNDDLYPNFFHRPPDKPTLRMNVIEPLREFSIGDYRILPVPVGHSVPATGYLVTDGDGKSLFYAGDTGPGLADCWRQIAPQLLIIEVTATDKFAEFGRKNRHMTPLLLKEELLSFRDMKGYLPGVAAVHMSPRLQPELDAQLAAVARELNVLVTVAHEGLELGL
jgi:ribonuclease BN (tRNA processing enzyme)